MWQVCRSRNALLPDALFEASGNAAVVLPEENANNVRQRLAPRALVCRRCHHVISSDSERIDVAGAHSHTCVNPHGTVYRIGCFSAAPGCSAIGTHSIQYSWFKGYSWQVTLCRHCQEHLGWRFRGSDVFFGLILKRLVSATG